MSNVYNAIWVWSINHEYWTSNRWRFLELHPADTPQHCVLYTIKFKADGNPLAYTGSIHGFGNESKGNEMRVRIIVEALLNKNVYLSHSFLEKGLE